MTGDGAFVPTNSDLLAKELETDEETKGMAMTRLTCGFHGENTCRNTSWERCLADTDNGSLWKSGSSIDWTKKSKKQCELLF